MSRSTTLFRYADVSRPRVFDLRHRAEADPALARVLADPEAQEAWAGELLADRAPAVLDMVRTRYAEIFAEDPIAGPTLPVPTTGAPDKAQKDADEADLLAVAVAAKLAGDDGLAREASRWLQALGTLTDPAPGADPAQGRPFAPPVLTGYAPPAEVAKVPDDKAARLTKPATDTAAKPAARDVAYLWRVRNQMLAARRDAARRAAMETRADRVRARPDPSDTTALLDQTAAPRRVAAGRAALRARVDEIRARRAAAAETRTVEAMDDADIGVSALLSMSADEAARLVKSVSAEEVAAVQSRLKETHAFTTALPEMDRLAFCRIYDAVAGAEETQGRQSQGFLEAAGVAYQGAVTGLLSECLDAPLRPGFGDQVRLLGIARLIKVEERLIGYSEGEIARIENVLAGEKRVSERKTLREFELIEEQSTEEIATTSAETSTTTTSELASEVERQLATRFSTDVSATASGGGGGSVGVVNFQGEGSVTGGASFGVDVSSSTSTESKLGREIVEATAETLSKTTRSRRMSRTRTLHEALERLEVDNSGARAENRRGVYCFLDKHVCVTETPYGLRWFLRATVTIPGRELLCASLTRLALSIAGNQAPPEFNLSPEMITPANYLQLAGKFRAQGLPVPPPPSIRVSRVYKCEKSNETTVEAKGLEGVGKALMPLMKAYGRHLITDVIQVPEDYEVQEVRIAVCHGANGLSVPVDLPLKLVSAGIMTAPIALSYIPYGIPVALWNILLLASPMVHHNTDSSFVSATVGVEAKESRYYYFDADELTEALMTLMGGLQTLGPMVMDQITKLATTMRSALEANAGAMVTLFTEMIGTIAGAAEDVFDAIGGEISDITNPANFNLVEFTKALLKAFKDYAKTTSEALEAVPDELFDPMQTFIDEVGTIIEDATESILGDLMESLQIGAENNDLLIYGAAAGLRGELPVNLNVSCLKPGLTANLSACLIRTDAALDRWRLEVFSGLHQSWMQQMADYEGRQFLGSDVAPTNPAHLRAEERTVLKARVIDALRRLSTPDPGLPTPNEMALFEHGIDWANMSHRIYRYGTGPEELLMEHIGAYATGDRARREFLTASWAEIMLPMSPNDELERAMLAWLEGGDATIGADLANDELATLWADVVSGRAQLEDATGRPTSRELVLPTEHIALRTDEGYPSDPGTACGPLG